MEEMNFSAQRASEIIQGVIDKCPKWKLRLEIVYKGERWRAGIYTFHRPDKTLKSFSSEEMTECLQILALWIAGGGIMSWKRELDLWSRPENRVANQDHQC